jgi:PucR C-terminal helix-turn-helix domain
VQELVRVSRAETVAAVRARLGDAIPEMVEVIGRGVPEYASAERPDYQQWLTEAVTHVVAGFIAHITQPETSVEVIAAEFRALGYAAAREGRPLDALQNALRLGARCAWRWLCEADAELDTRELTRVGEAIFGYLDELAAACAKGYAEATTQIGENPRRRLVATILAEPQAGPELIADAQVAGWPLPAQVAVVVLDAPASSSSPGHTLPPDVLADWTSPEPRLIVPDPSGPGRAAAIDRALPGITAAVGPAVPLSRAATSLRWARQALTLARSGVIATTGAPVRCDQHLSTLLIFADEDLGGMLRAARLAPLARLRPAQRDRVADTLLAWLQLGENAAEVAHQVHVHPQTVRYRLRRIYELFGDQLRDPDMRFELQVALRTRKLLAG